MSKNRQKHKPLEELMETKEKTQPIFITTKVFVTDCKTTKVLNLVATLQKTTTGKTLYAMSQKYAISIRTVKRYIDTIDKAGFNVIRDLHEGSRQWLYRIEQ